MSHPHPLGGTKQHAQLRDEERRVRPLWVHDDDDWATMRALPAGSLTCPSPGCSTLFGRPIQNARGTRFLRDMPGSSCGHDPYARSDLGGGGLMSAEHLWLEGRVARVCEVAGQVAITEHYATHADVYVPGRQLAIEVQRWSTDYQRRTRARQRAGASVLWLLPEDGGAPNARSTTRALFELPAARLRVHRRGNRQELLQPWLHPDQRREARLTVFGTVGRLNRQTMKLESRMHDLAAFLDEIFSGRRHWYPPGTAGLPSASGGCWVLTADLDTTRAHHSATRPGPSARPFPGQSAAPTSSDDRPAVTGLDDLPDSPRLPASDIAASPDPLTASTGEELVVSTGPGGTSCRGRSCCVVRHGRRPPGRRRHQRQSRAGADKIAMAASVVLAGRPTVTASSVSRVLVGVSNVGAAV